tara:strand:+ start:201 stop:470 length:270 start_codon:yes stop_codon:yes gene_type:complete
MCINLNVPEPAQQTPPPAIAPRIEGSTELPQSQDLIQEGEQADVQIGSSKKQAGPAAAQKTGPESLKIKLNQPGQNEKAANQGGLTIGS